ncbi:NUDIX hydrolase [Agaribacterium haliotis]|uniref:NUDIX hydrolase n=1 Tax=Agaribacterium haliotis TaxID=2013869 RepID=UPI000BB5485D|nr:CoA pyrophosphatase [Agaribacterium haliotis]
MTNFSAREAHAAVVLVLRHEAGKDSVLLTKRAAHMREHPGEVAFPGGKRDIGDSSLYRTALRECEEEVGLKEHQLRYRAELGVQRTRSRALVLPFVVELVGSAELCLSTEEIDSAFWAPLPLFVEDKRSCTHVFESRGREYWAPVYRWQGYEIWGFTARVLVDFVNTFYGGQLQRRHCAPELRL